MFGTLYIQAEDLDGDLVLVGYPAVRISTHYGAHGVSNKGPAFVEIITGRLKGRQFRPIFLEPGATPNGSEQFVPCTHAPNTFYFGKKEPRHG
jgi:hypothetical protein